MKLKTVLVLFLLAVISLPLGAEPWVADLGDGTYKNPVLFADYSDPDVIRVGDDFYMVASSFTCIPGVPVLHSKDMVNWTIIGHVYDRLPLEKYNEPVHGEGSWAPSIRYHDGMFYVYFCTPHDGLFMGQTKDPVGKWDLHHVVDVEMWEDPCPLWDDDGNAYLVRSKLRADILYLHKMSPDGKQILDNGTIIYYNMDKHPTIEGPKFMKKDGYYYILAPAGGVGQGWQTALRSKNIYGPYEDQIVLHTGSTDINGPHQGGLVELESGEWWFMHFQERQPWGRIVHLQPVHWENGWPMMGKDIDNDGIGEPVASWKKPDVGKTWPVQIPQTTDEFNEKDLGLQWQWQANPQDAWYSLTANPGNMRLYATRNLTQFGNLLFVPNLLLQKLSSPAFTATTKLVFNPDLPDEKAGLVMMGNEWAHIVMNNDKDGMEIAMYVGKYDRENDATQKIETVKVKGNTCYLQLKFSENGECSFYYSLDGKDFLPLGTTFDVIEGHWIGAKVGIFCSSPNMQLSKGYADFDWFKMD